jgi:GMP synthase-like glutamine amidotransferase
MRWNTFEIICYGERLLLRQYKGETIKETLMREFGWLLKPITEQTKSFEKSLDKLNWKIEKKYK